MAVVIGLIVVGVIIVFASTDETKRREETEGRFESAAAAVGFTPQAIAPKPTAEATAWAQRGRSYHPFGLIPEGKAFPGMTGMWNGTRISVWEESVRINYEDSAPTRTTHYLATFEIDGPPFFLQKKQPRFRQRQQGVWEFGKDTPAPEGLHRMEIGNGEFAESFTTHGTDQAALAQYLNEPMQAAITDLAHTFERIEITNYGIQASAGIFSADVDHVTRRLDNVALVANTMLGANA